MSDARVGLASVLRELRGGGSFSTRRTAPTEDLLIEVQGVGGVRLPVTAGQAKALRLIARPAKYGQGEQTVLDRRVRDTWEVPRSRVRIDQRRWGRTLRPMLDSIRDDLGLPPGTSLTAQLHSMLVYEPGQFFASHQDSEKNDEMIGTLVVMLPSRSTGGDLVVGHGSESARYRGSASSLTFVAFYSDTRHEVLPVETGYRVVLTYNLLLAGDTTTGRGEAGSTVATTAALLHRHFAQAPAPRWDSDRTAEQAPDRLVVLLDHQYTARGLRWSHLKGDDAARVGLLRRAADLAGCDMALALAEIHETRQCLDDAPGYDYPGGWSDWDDDLDIDDDGSYVSEVEVGEVIESEVTLAPAADETVRLDSHVDDAELVEVTPTVELSPDSEYTGFMGNWGNTMDRWYRRAAVVLWPRARAFAILAKGDPSGALDDLLSPTPADEPSHTERSDRVGTLLRSWPYAVRTGDQKLLLPRTLRLARELDDEEQSARLLEPFAVEALTPADAPALVALAEHYGRDWFQRTLTAWLAVRYTPAGQPSAARAEWVTSLPQLCAGLCDDREGPAGTGPDVARAIVERIGDWLIDAIRQAAGVAQPSRRLAALATLADPTLSLLRAAKIVGVTALRERIVGVVCDPSPPSVQMLVDIVTATAALAPEERAAIGVDAIAQRCRDALAAELSKPPRAADDWAITELRPGICCDDCTALAQFLAEPTAMRITWPLAKPRRQHIHRRVDEAELPVTHTTSRQGRPYKLVLTKTPELHIRDAERRLVAQESLDEVERYLDRVPPS